LIDEAEIADAQKKGKSSRLVDPKPALSTTGDMKVIMTPQLALDIFEEWPVVARAFRENVSSKVHPWSFVHRETKPVQQMSEAEFWKRYFESRLYHNHKASVRSSAAQHIIQEDVIFDQYLEAVDDGEILLFTLL
jgi:transcription initiation factor TFIIH subunit 1